MTLWPNNGYFEMYAEGETSLVRTSPDHQYGPHSSGGVTFPPSLDPHRCLIRDFLVGPIDGEKTVALVHLVVAAERTLQAEGIMWTPEEVGRAIAAAIKVERERCAKIVQEESYLSKFPDGDEGGCEGCATGWCQSAVDAVCEQRNRIAARIEAGK